jgi:hypothetical protein
MPDRACILCGSPENVVWVAGVDANLCASCRSQVYAHELLSEKPLQDKGKC